MEETKECIGNCGVSILVEWTLCNECCGGMFSKKNKYPDNPMKKQQVIEDDIQLTEEQKDYYCDQFVKRLQRMERRFNKSKEKMNKEIINMGG